MPDLFRHGVLTGSERERLRQAKPSVIFWVWFSLTSIIAILSSTFQYFMFDKVTEKDMHYFIYYSITLSILSMQVFLIFCYFNSWQISIFKYKHAVIFSFIWIIITQIGLNHLFRGLYTFLFVEDAFGWHLAIFTIPNPLLNFIFWMTVLAFGQWAALIYVFNLKAKYLRHFYLYELSLLIGVVIPYLYFLVYYGYMEVIAIYSTHFPGDIKYNLCIILINIGIGFGQACALAGGLYAAQQSLNLRP